MSQFDVNENPSSQTAGAFPFLLEVQSTLFADSARVVIVPLVLAHRLSQADRVLNPEFEVRRERVVMVPLDIASASRKSLGDFVESLSRHGDEIVASLDLLFSRY